jgi:hypothetical protein
LVIKLSVDLVPTYEQIGYAFVVFLLEYKLFHFMLHLFKFRSQRELLLSSHSDVLDLFYEGEQVECLKVSDFDVIFLERTVSNLVTLRYAFLDKCPIFIKYSFRSETLDQRKVLRKTLYDGSEILSTLRNFRVVFVQIFVKLQAGLAPCCHG